MSRFRSVSSEGRKPSGCLDARPLYQAQGDRRLDGVVRVLALSAWLPARRSRRVPVGELAIGESEPDGQTPASAETRLVLPPIPDTVGLLDVLPLGALETRQAGPRISGWRAIIDRRSRVVHQGSGAADPRQFSRRCAARSSSSGSGLKKNVRASDTIARTSPLRGRRGTPWRRPSIRRAWCYSMKVAIRTDLVRRYGRGLYGARVTDHAPDGRWHTTCFRPRCA